MLDLFRVLAVIFLVMHGLVHLLWFVASWTSVRTGFRYGAWVLPGQVTIRSPIGRIWGLGGVVVFVLFSLGAIGLVLAEPAWANWTNLGVLLSYGVVVPFWRQSPGSVGVTAVLVNIMLMFLLALPLADDLIAA
jgi:hypothetical protein